MVLTCCVRLESDIASVIVPPRWPSPADGVVHWTACAGNGVPPAPKAWFGPPFSRSDERGVDQSATASSSRPRASVTLSRSGPVIPSPVRGVGQFAATLPSRPFSGTFDRSPVSFQSRVVAVGHAEDEDTFALMARTDFRRREQSDLNRETKLAKVSPYPLGSSDFVSPRREHAANILDEDEPAPRLDDDAPRVGPEVALVELTLLSPGKAVRLARDAANEAVHASTPASAVEGSGIAPHRSRSHETLFHRCHQVRDGEGFPLHEHD